MSDNNLYRQVKKFADDKTDTPILISGVLGVTIDGKKTVEVPNRDGFVWVKLRGSQSELIQVYNTTVSPIYGLPVLVTRQNNRYSIYGRDLNQYQDWGNSSYLPKHGTQHSFAPELGIGGDITWVYGRQIIPLLSMPSGTDGAPNLIINPLTYKNANGGWNYIGDEATADVTVAKPTTADARLMLLYWDTELGTSGFVTGTFFAATITGTSAITPFIPDLPGNTKIPISAVRLVSGSTNITWDNIYDVRQFATPSNPLGISIWDEGIPQGTGTVLDFTGAGIQATISGSVVNVNVTATGGGGGGIGVWTSGSAGAYSITTLDGTNDSLATQSVSHGINTVASGTYSHAEGNNTLAQSNATHAEGSNTKAIGGNSHTEGLNTTTYGTSSHAEGFNTITSGSYSHAEGQQTDAIGNSSHAEGYDNVAAGTASHAEGGLNSVSGTYSHVEGYNNRITGGEASHAAGFSNQVSGNYSAIVSGRNHSLNANYSAILAGSGITGSADNTAYTDLMNVKSLNTGTSASIVGIDTGGFLVTGTLGLNADYITETATRSWLNQENLGDTIKNATSQNPPIGADSLALWDSAADDFKRLTITNLTTYMQSAIGGGREVLSADRTYYVDPTSGSDSNDGLSPGAGAFATIQKAVDTTASLDISIYDVTIQLADDTYTTGATISGPWVGTGSVSIVGNSGTPANVLVSVTSQNAFTVTGGAVITIQDLKIQTTTTGHGIYVENLSVAYFANINFGACAQQHTMSTISSIVWATGNYAISGGAQRHHFSTGVATIVATGITITLSGTPAFSVAFSVSSLDSTQNISGNTYSGSATGKRYDVTLNGSMYTNGGATYLPGNAAGTTATGGQYA